MSRSTAAVRHSLWTARELTMDRMRILQLAPPWFAVPPIGYGGIERIAASLADGLSALGHEVTLLASGGSTTTANLWTVFDTPPSAHLGSVPHELCHVLPAYHNRWAFDVIHDHSGLIGPALAGLLDGPPVVHTLHGPWNPTVGEVYAAISDGVHLVAISHDQAARSPDGVRLSSVVHNGIPVHTFPFRSAPRTNHGYLAFVGRASPEKGLDDAIKVAAQLQRPLRMAVKINEACEQRYWHQVIVPMLDEADVEVVINGTTQYAVGLLAGADAALFPVQWEEPFGLVMVEAMACGTPVVAYARGAAPEVIAHGETGFLIEPSNRDAFCDAVQRVGDIDPVACRRRVEDDFSEQAMTTGYERIFLTLTGLPRPSPEPTPAVTA